MLLFVEIQPRIDPPERGDRGSGLCVPGGFFEFIGKKLKISGIAKRTVGRIYRQSLNGGILGEKVFQTPVSVNSGRTFQSRSIVCGEELGKTCVYRQRFCDVVDAEGSI